MKIKGKKGNRDDKLGPANDFCFWASKGKKGKERLLPSSGVFAEEKRK